MKLLFLKLLRFILMIFQFSYIVIIAPCVLLTMFISVFEELDSILEFKIMVTENDIENEENKKWNI